MGKDDVLKVLRKSRRRWIPVDEIANKTGIGTGSTGRCLREMYWKDKSVKRKLVQREIYRDSIKKLTSTRIYVWQLKSQVA